MFRNQFDIFGYLRCTYFHAHISQICVLYLQETRTYIAGNAIRIVHSIRIDCQMEVGKVIQMAEKL